MTLGELRAQRNGGGITLGELRQRRYGSQPSNEKEDEDNDWNYANIPVIGPVIKNAADTLTSQIGLQTKGLGMELQALADTADRNNNPNVNSGLYRTAGGALSDFGGWLENKAAEGEKYHPSQEWNETRLSDIISDPETLKRYATDPQGFQAELGSGIGSGLGFAALARLFPSFAAEKVASKALEPASKLLGNIGLNKAAQAVGSNTAKELLGSSVQFGSTMGPAGALTNAATIIGSLKEQGLSDAEIAERMNSLIGEELPADIAFAALTGNVVKGHLGKLAPRNSTAFQKAMANAAAGIPLEAAGGYYSNVNQMILSDKYSGKPYGTLTDPLPNESTAGRLGILAGLPFSIYGARQGYQNATGQTSQNTYLGGNGKGEGKYWVRNPNMNVSTEGMRPEALNALDMLGKYYFDHTGKPLILNAGTNGDHAAGEFSHANGWKFDAIDQLEGDGPLITANYGRGPFLDQFVKYGRSLGLGMNFEDEGTRNVHLDVAVDGTQWDGNGDHAGGFNPRNARPFESSTQENNQGNNSPAQWNQYRQQQPQKQEPTKPPFDINAEDETTQKLLDKFANKHFNEAVNNEDEEAINFFDGMFTDVDRVSAFQNTPENRNAVIERYGEELSKFIQDNAPAQTQPTAQPATNNSNVKQADNPYQKNAAIKTTANNFLEQLRAKGDISTTGFKLQNALNKGNFTEVENILKQNNVAIPQPQQAQPAPIQQNPVKENKPPENILTQPTNTSGNEKLIKAASKAVTKKTSHEGKKKIGNAILQLANQSGISVPAVDFKSLQNGSSKKIAEWQAKLSQAGAFAIFSPQTQQQTTQATQEKPLSLKEQARRILAVKQGEAVKQQYEKLKAAQKIGENITYDESQSQGDATGEGYIDTPFFSQEDMQSIKNIQHQRAADKAVASRPSLSNFSRRAEIAHDLRTPTAADTTKAKNFDDIPAWRGRTREDNLALSLQGRDKANLLRQRQMSEQIQSLDTGEISASRIGQNTPESENFHVQTPQEITTQREQEQKAQEHQKQLRLGYSDIDSGTDQTGNTPRQINENITNPDDMIGNNIAQRIADNEEASKRKLGDKYTTEQGEVGVAQGQSNISNPDDMIGNIFKNFTKQKQRQSNKTAQSPSPQQPQKVQPVQKNNRYGNTAEVITGSRKPYQIQYRVVEANELKTSHEIDNGGVFANKNYPSELQPRNRERANMQAQVISMSNNLNPADLMDARDVNQGAPVVRNDGTVLNGNGRTAAIRYAYQNGKGDAYKNSLIERAQDFGLNADEISKMNQPVLIRELAGDLTTEDLQDITTTQTGGAIMGASEKAQADARKLSADTLAIFPQNDNADLTSAEANDFLQSALRDIATPDELNSFTTDDGRINQDGINRVKRALFALAYDDGGLISRMSESTDDNVRGATNALLTAAPAIAKVRVGMKNGTLHKYDLSAIADAVKKLSTLRDQNKAVANYLQEQSLFGEDSAEMKEILSVLDRYKRAPNKIAAFLKKTANNIQEQGAPRQGSLFGESEPAPLIDLVKQARQEVENNGQTTPMFSLNGEVDTRIDNFVDDKDLTPQQKLQQNFGNKLGVQTVFFNNENGDFHGAHANGTSYINVNSKMPISKVFWHEAMHWLKANNPELYQKLVEAAGITTDQRQAYLRETGRKDIRTPDEINEEILADQFEDVAKRSGLLQSIAGKNRGLIQRVVQWLKDTMNKFIDHFRNPSGKLTTNQSIALADEFGRIAKDLVDPNGQKIFRHNRRTQNIEPIDGRSSSESVRNSSEPKSPPAGAKIKYSIGNDNSSESLIEKIKNKLSWFSGDKKTIRRKKVITAKLRELSGHRILYGNVKGANAIVVDHLQKLIQSRNTYDWNKLLPVVSKEIAKNLKLNPTTEQSNLIADWLLTGALNNTSAEMKAFQKAMRDNPAMADILLETRNLFQEIADMPADEQISSSLVDLKSKPFFEGDFTEEVLDDLSPLQEVVDTAIKNSSPEMAELIKRNVNPKQLAQLSRGSGAIADVMVNGKAVEIEKIRAMLSEKYTGVYFDKFKPINAIIKSVGGDWKGLQTYAVAKLSKEMYEYNRAHPELETPLIPYTTEAAADATIKQGEAKFGEAQKDLVIYSKVLLAMEHDSGLITDNTFYLVLKSWENYVPMAQVFDENEDYTKLDYLKRRKGHEGDTWSPIQIMIVNTHKRIQACERNKVKLELANLVRFGGFDSNLSEVASSNPDADNIIRFRENGKIKYLETPDPAIKRAVDSLQSKSDGTWITKMLRAITGFMRMRLTGGNLDFAAGNIFRDLPDAYIHNNQLGKDVFIIGDFMRAWGSAVKELIQDARGKGMSQDLIDWKMSGGAQASFVSGDVDYIQRSIDEATSTHLQRYRKKPFMQFLDDMQRISEFTEDVTRLTTYKLAKGRLTKGRAATITDKQLAALAAREASVDFAKAGRSTRKVNQIVLFANAAVQSLNLWIEAGKEFRKGNSKPLFGKLFRAAAHGVLMAALQAAIAHAGDDDDKKAYEQAPNWEKETYWIFPSIKNPITDSGLRIPKAFDVGMRFMANLTDETIGATFDNKPFEGKRFWETFKGALPSLTATILSPAIEAYTNYSVFRDAPIVPLREQHLDATEQYDANSSWIAKTISKNTVPLAKIFNARTGWSPRKIDYMINGYLGFMGRFITNPSTDPDKFPMVRRFVFEPYKNPKIVQEYYEAYEEQTSHYNTYKQTKEKPDDFDPALYKRLKAANETMRKISNRERAIQNDENLSYGERRAKLVELEKKRVALCEKVFNKAR